MPNYEPLQERAYTYLKNWIINGGMVPKVIYSETRMASEIGISRTPMKDALVRLKQDKFIDIIPSKGFLLHIMTPQDIWSTYQARTAVEGFCAFSLAEKKDTPQGLEVLGQMKRSMEEMARLIDVGAGTSELLPCDLDFHRALAGFPENEELSRLFESLSYRVSVIALDSFGQPGRPQAALAEHWAIYDAIMSGGEEGRMEPYMAVIRHMEESRDICLAHQGKLMDEGLPLRLERGRKGAELG